jgi:hypothetical protein
MARETHPIFDATHGSSTARARQELYGTKNPVMLSAASSQISGNGSGMNESAHI